MKRKDSDLEEKAFLSPGDILRTARDYWALALILGAPLGYLHHHIKIKEEPLFSAGSMLMFEVDAANIIAVREVTDTTLTGQGNPQLGMENYLIHLRSQSFIQEVVDSLSESERKRVVDPYITVENPTPSPAGIIFGGFRVNLLGQGTTVRVSTNHRDPEMSAFLANRITDRFSIFVTRRAVNSNEAAVKFLRSEAEEFRQKVRESELALQKYREVNEAISLDESQNLVEVRLAAVESSVTQAKLALVQTRTAWEKAYESIESGLPPIKVPALMGYGDIRTSITNVNRLEGQQELLSAKYGRRHPNMVDISEQLAIAKSQLDALIQEGLVYLEGQYEASLATYNSLDSELQKLEQESLRLDKLRVDYQDLLGRNRSLKQSYDAIISRLDETTIANKLVQSPVRVVDYASVPSTPFSPDPNKILVTSIGLGFVVFAGVIGLVAVLDRRLRSSVSIESQLGREVLGEVPVLRRFTTSKRYFIVRDNLDTALRELFQNISGRSELVSKGVRPRSILITSCQPEEGKSLISTNLAYAFGSQGMKVALVDVDMRAPSLDALIGYEDRPGVIDWYTSQTKDLAEGENRIELSDIVVDIDGGVDLYPAGEAVENPSAVTPVEALGSLASDLKEKYDIVIMDAPPGLMFHDAIALADYVDQTIVVCRFLKATMTRLTKLFQLLDKTKSRKIGVVFNGVPRSAAQSDYYSKVQYYYGRKRSKSKKQFKAKKDSDDAAEAVVAAAADGEAMAVSSPESDK